MQLVPPKCSTIFDDPHEPCTKIATHVLIYSSPDPETDQRHQVVEAVCKTCGDGYVRRPSLRARLVPLKPEMYGQYEIKARIPLPGYTPNAPIALPNAPQLVIGEREGHIDRFVVASQYGADEPQNGVYASTEADMLRVVAKRIAEALKPPTRAEVREFEDGPMAGGSTNMIDDREND